MWSLYMGQRPYVVKAGRLLPNALFPHFPESAPPPYKDLSESCLRRDSHERPTFSEITVILAAFFESVFGVDGGSGSSLLAPAALNVHVGEEASTSISCPVQGPAPSTRHAMMIGGSHTEWERGVKTLAKSYLASLPVPSSSSLDASSPTSPEMSAGGPVAASAASSAECQRRQQQQQQLGRPCGDRLA